MLVFRRFFCVFLFVSTFVAIIEPEIGHAQSIFKDKEPVLLALTDHERKEYEEHLGIKIPTMQTLGLKDRIGAVEPFSNVYGVKPGIDDLQSIVSFLGNPDNVEIKPRKKADGTETIGTRLIRYRILGIIVVISYTQASVKNPIIDSIVMERPFRGKTSDGVHIGMAKNEALKILNENYHLYRDIETMMQYTNSKDDTEGGHIFTIWFNEENVIRMSVNAPVLRAKKERIKVNSP